MRIRQHARISALSIAESSLVSPPPPPPPQPVTSKIPRTHGLCGLNRSPWDVLAFRDHYQVKMSEDVKGNNFKGESSIAACASKSKHCEMEVKKKKKKVEGGGEEDEEGAKRLFSLSEADKEEKKSKKRAKKKKYLYCIKSDGKGWQCKKEVKEGHSLCEYHLNKLRSYQCKQTRSSRKPRRRNSKGRGSSSSSASVMDFYYYDGFSPSAGRRRAIEGKESNKEEDDHREVVQTKSASTHATHVHDDVEDDDDNDVHVNVYDDNVDVDDDEDYYIKDLGCKKRIRRPIKERSLKSLL